MEEYGVPGRRWIAPEHRRRCGSCSALLGSDNQRGIAGSGLCSPCYGAEDEAATDRLADSMLTIMDPIKAYRAVFGQTPGRMLPASLCRNGHQMTAENTYVRPDGSEECQACRALARSRHAS